MSMSRRPRSRITALPFEILPIMQLWLLRILISLGAQRQFILAGGFMDDNLAEIIGLGHWIDSPTLEFDAKAVLAELRQLHKLAERASNTTKAPLELSKNVDRLATLVGMSDVDCRILEFAILFKNEGLLDVAADWLGDLSSMKVFRVLSQILDLSEAEIRDALGAQSTLATSGLVKLDRNRTTNLRGKLDLISDNFADSILSLDADPIDLLREMVAPSKPAQLSLSDYDHIAPSLNVLRAYLKHAVSAKRKGVNIFLYGDPGTGKSQLAKVLAQELGCELFEVTSEDADGDAVNGERRLRAFRAAQSFFTQRQALIVFDEAEDVFADGNDFMFKRSTAQTRKAWVNRTLEENAVPTLWLSNSISGLDRAFIRRFDMVIEIPVPPKKQRARILANNCANLLDASSLARMAESEALAPAVVARAAAVVLSICDELGHVASAAAFEMLIANTLAAQGHKPIKKNDPNRLPETYDPMFINADADLRQIASGLVTAKSGRLCLYGSPGTGKTAFARWLAEKMGVPLLVKRASDLMSMWLGENEKNIADAFKQAEQENAVLLIDEVDSFLQDRRGAQRGWEVTLVNEMLTQMESFSGVFVASTNLMQGLDQAALRRFDLKVKFDYLNGEQACELLRRHCAALSLPTPSPVQLAQLTCLRTLTPGDFAAVTRQTRFRPIASAVQLVAALEVECALKEGARATLGFM